MEKSIREIKGLELFQLPPCEEIVRGLAREGPLVAVNITHLRSDAIIVTTEGIKTIELTELELNDLKKKVGIFQRFGSVSRSAVGIERNAIPVPGGEYT
ncbi:hypothetical protein QBC42DRAFT_286558 [Cladorrhinum samala]|uniref:Uncharacterized protein n=1 Tax=Cladorrhinum samala TaxID=585594 RepID=A0AAV9HNN2_9PEZI|nr:hypothetical protein QBC42DRAFT_286558 [Cladorrhinum samala]